MSLGISNFRIEEIESSDIRFPKNLKEIKKTPKKIYIRGCLDNHIFSKTISVIGSRKFTSYGKNTTENFVSYLTRKGVTIVSGFMYGIDTIAHKSCLNNGGKTIAVLGCGLNQIYPRENTDLYLRILESGGLIMSEYDPDFKATNWSFPQRNRIVAALANVGVLVVEAGEKSGSLITANYGLEMQKKVFCIPGMINSPSSKGCNELLKDKRVTVCTNPKDILDEKEEFKNEQIKLWGEADCQTKKIIERLMFEPTSINELSKFCDLEVSKVSIVITKLMIKQLVTEVEGRYFLKV